MLVSVPVIHRLNNFGDNGRKCPIRGEDIGERLGYYETLLDLLPAHNGPAVCEPANPERTPLTHSDLNKFLRDGFDLRPFGIPYGYRVAILLPNGPHLAVAVVATISHWCAAPINPTNTWQEIKMELLSTRSAAVLVLAGSTVNEAAVQAAKEVGIGVLALAPHPTITGLFDMSVMCPFPPDLPRPPPPRIPPPGCKSFGHPATVLLLHTSGTSGNKKLVAYSLDAIVIGVGCIIASWNLQPSDVCLNMMPLFHIGGIVRNVLSPLLSGGAVIACSGFDSLLFWDVLYSAAAAAAEAGSPARTSRKEEAARLPRVTWYYAAPTMHHAILTEADQRAQPWPVQSIRFIANAAGGLLPVLAARLRDTFQATILTSYGMTECMPISSPPQHYALQPPGTSGTPVGPDILIVDDDLRPLPPGAKGNIFVRGPPCFSGYEDNDSATDESFFAVPGHGAGWFSTGDMGHVDEQHYLFISGRSKEVINRGGETISPFEIEEALVQHPHIREALAFSAPHDQFQETVGAVVVSHPDKPRVDLPSLHSFLETRLHRSKWPQLLVFSEALPKNATGKVLRIRYAERIGLGAVDEESAPLSRLLEARCPPPGTSLATPIPAQRLSIDYDATLNFFRRQTGVQDVAVVLVDLPSQCDALVALLVLHTAVSRTTASSSSSSPLPSSPPPPSPAMLASLLEACRQCLPAYLVPSQVFDVSAIPSTTNAAGNIVPHVDALRRMAVALYERRHVVAPRNAIERQIEALWRALLGAPTAISVTTSFFDLGGDSLKAGQVIGRMRTALRVPLTVADLFTAPTIAAMAAKISMHKTLGSPHMSSSSWTSPPQPSPALVRHERRRHVAGRYEADRQRDVQDRQSRFHREYMTWDFTPAYSSEAWTCLFVQVLPLAVVYPLRRIAIWFLLAAPWVALMRAGGGRFASLLAAMFLARVAMGLGAPLVGIAAKWAIIGRYQAGRYPLWGSMYLKWWLVEQIVNILGKGFFRDDLPLIGGHMVRWYYILMGASIGANVNIHKDAKLGQADLLTIHDNVSLDNCTLRPFSLEEGHFVLLPITVGEGCSVGVKSVVAAGAHLPPHTCLGPLSSSHEAATDADPSYRQYCRPTFPPPPAWMVIFLGIPLLLLVLAVSFVPWFLVLRLMVADAKAHAWYAHDVHSVYHAFLWWITPRRLAYFLLLRVTKRCVVPFLRLAMIIAIKRVVVGRFEAIDAAAKQQATYRFRYWLMHKLLPGGGLGGVARLVGTHYEAISVIYRLLGAEVGQRVYWPGSGLDIVEVDLLAVGNDVVFGSRSVVLTSSTTASKKVVFEDGAMVADRCVILPGAVVRRGAVLGSGALAAEDMDVPVGSVWLGAQEGRALNVAPPDATYATCSTLTPFGKAFYLGQASYTVIPLYAIILYNTLWQAFCTCYRNCPTVLSLMLCSYLQQFDPFDDHSAAELFRLSLVSFSPLHLSLCTLALAIDVAGKWLLLGRRQPGVYAWDKSSYCQRWQVYLTLQEIRRGERRKTGILDMIQGSAYLVWYFRWLGASIGNNVCLYPNGGDPMMTEPDLVTIGDFAAVDDASLIAHINTRGVFRLNPLSIGTGCVLKTMSRLLSGASMEAHSILLEHSLVLAGEQVEAGSVWQGWPNRSQVRLKAHRAQVRQQLDEVGLRRAAELMASGPGPGPRGAGRKKSLGYGAVDGGLDGGGEGEDEDDEEDEEAGGRAGGRQTRAAAKAGGEGSATDDGVGGKLLRTRSEERQPLLGRR